MRKHALLASVIGMSLALLTYSESSARVSGLCANCHTMHNSQDGTAMKLDGADPTGQLGSCIECHADTLNVLLRMDCVGCHAEAPGGGNNISPTTGAPQVAHDSGTDLAGGNFYHILANDDTHGHNVHGFGGGIPSGDLSNIPPGYSTDFDPSTGKYQADTGNDQIMCAGQNGCHGNREEVGQVAAMFGSHHADDSILQFGAAFTEVGQGNTVGTSYRYLYKVKGAEDSDWQAATTGTNHNEYRGVPFDPARASQAWGDIETMSQFCAECHGVFHSGAGLGGADPWIRHPSDVILPGDAPYSDYTIYDTNVPIARQSIAAGSLQASGAVAPTSDIVFCLSCHRAHASAYPDSLRWDYTNECTTNTADPSTCGCFTCHNDKDYP